MDGFWLDFGGFWEGFGRIFGGLGGFLDGFWKVVGKILEMLGIIWPCWDIFSILDPRADPRSVTMRGGPPPSVRDREPKCTFLRFPSLNDQPAGVRVPRQGIDPPPFGRI